MSCYTTTSATCRAALPVPVGTSVPLCCLMEGILGNSVFLRSLCQVCPLEVKYTKCCTMFNFIQVQLLYLEICRYFKCFLH